MVIGFDLPRRASKLSLIVEPHKCLGKEARGIVGNCRLFRNSKGLYHHEASIIWIRLPKQEDPLYLSLLSCIMLETSATQELESFRDGRTGYINGPIDMHRL